MRIFHNDASFNIYLAMLTVFKYFPKLSNIKGQ